MIDKKELLPLTGLRFVAAMIVFLFHIHIRWPITQNTFLSNTLNQGAVGMSLFFMLSGFLLAYNYVDGKSTLKNYLINRFARIYPVYVAAAIITLPWIGITFGNGSETEIVRGIAQAALLIFSNVFLIQAWFLQFFSFWNDGGSWSISVEVFCYVMLPFILPTLARYSRNGVLVTAGICLILGVLPGLSAALFEAPSVGVFYSMPIFRLPEFLLGTCTYLGIRLGLKNQYSSFSQFIVLFFFTVYLGFLGPKMPLYVGHNWITLPVISFMIFSLANGTGCFATVLSHPVLVWLGKISYCFYSFQCVLILLLISHHDSLIQRFPFLAQAKILTIFSLVFLVAISALAYYIIEQPARNWIKESFKKARILKTGGTFISQANNMSSEGVI